ncbi:PTS sugar transporter subunit IIA [Psittacicella hinzii]|uniref:Ascorbate-specific PTS system EIIA component n=1 Tax=Psittacicella hinzii TaxID=2028575 RepID=A0A3A1YPU7_9GAMM|nr:PTS sugar transporter subunit IIA [Psittacicella hinzii]RIY40313.1 hypothetical protein CKF58_00680 [Psittacicella hinzii]
MDIIFAPAISCKTPTEVITRVGALMESHGLATTSYTEAMLDVYYKHGNYIVLDEGIAMPHARPETGALKNGLVFVLLSSPVIFQHPEYDPVKVAIGLCSTGNTQHLELLTLVSELIDAGIGSKDFDSVDELQEFVTNIQANIAK